MQFISNRKGLAVAIASASLAALACTCGALSGLTQIAEQAEAVSTQAVAVATVASAEEGLPVPDIADGEIPDVGDLPAGLLGTDIDGCALITEEEALAVIGAPIRETIAGPGSCFRDGENSREVSVVVLSPGTPEAAQVMFEVARDSSQSEGGYVEVPGPWADGIWDAAGGGILYFRQDAYFVFVSADNPENFPDSQAQSTQLATLVSSRLP